MRIFQENRGYSWLGLHVSHWSSFRNVGYTRDYRDRYEWLWASLHKDLLAVIEVKIDSGPTNLFACYYNKGNINIIVMLIINHHWMIIMCLALWLVLSFTLCTPHKTPWSIIIILFISVEETFQLRICLVK